MTATTRTTSPAAQQQSSKKSIWNRLRWVGITGIIAAVAFSIAGNDFNQYWGSMTAPLFCLSASRAPRMLGRLWSVAAGREALVLPRSATLAG